MRQVSRELQYQSLTVMNILIVCFLFSLVLVQARVLEQYNLITRIVNGKDVELGERPFQVSLRDSDLDHFCGGSIINEYWVLTAAHCVRRRPIKETKVVAGTVSLSDIHESHETIKIIVHENFSSSASNRHDIALIKVATPFEFSDIVQPVKLPEPHMKVKINSSTILSGWGGLEGPYSPASEKLQKVTIYVSDQKYCDEVVEEHGDHIYPTNICAYDPSIRKGQCTGDSGGPLTLDEKLIGIVSWSIKDPICGSKKYPGVYTRVSEYIDWIFENMKIEE